MARLFVEIILSVLYSPSPVFFHVPFRIRTVSVLRIARALYFVRMEISFNFASHSSYLTPFTTSTYSNFSKFMNFKAFLNIMKISPSQITYLSSYLFVPKIFHRENKRSVLILTTRYLSHCLNYARRCLERYHLLKDISTFSSVRRSESRRSRN